MMTLSGSQISMGAALAVIIKLAGLSSTEQERSLFL